MITSEQVKPVVEEKIAGTDVFIVELLVHPGNRIQVILDGDSGITIDTCVGVHRAIEKHFDREVEDYELSVSSAGVGEPLKVRRQYSKNVGREVSIKLPGGHTTEGTLTAVSDSGITVQNKVKEEVPGKKGKKWVDKTHEIPFEEITEAIINISFK